MRVSRRVLLVGLASLTNLLLLNFCLPTEAAAQPSDQLVAERVLGPRWKDLSRRAGMIFAGTILTATAQPATPQTPAPDHVVPSPIPAVQLTFRVDHAIAGVKPGQILTIHEWAGATSTHRPMRGGQQILIFLYPLSRLGLTSPVGGSLGLVALDPSGKNVSGHQQKPAADATLRNDSSTRKRVPVPASGVSVAQLERAIRSARQE
jgi:hypothetical protein